jgi:hypothetical protein
MRALALLVLLPAVALASSFSASSAGSCGVNMSCTPSSVTVTTTSGAGFACSAELASCVDLGPGTLNSLGTNASGDILVGDGNVTVRVGGSGGAIVMTGNGSLTNTNGAVNCDGNCQIRDSGNGVLPINTTGGVSINSTSNMTGFHLVPVTLDIPAIAGACDLVTATVAGVEANDGVFITTNFDMGPGAEVQVSNARVTNAGTDQVTFLACDPSGGGLDPASGAYLFWVVRKA